MFSLLPLTNILDREVVIGQYYNPINLKVSKQTRRRKIFIGRYSISMHNVYLINVNQYHIELQHT